jgi:hypothetical protein
MFGGKLTRDSLHRTVSNIKSHIAHGYHKAKSFLGHVDHGVRVAKQVYSALAPAIEHYGGGHVNKHVIKGIGGYDQLRNKVMDAHDSALQHVNQVTGHLKKSKISIGL